MLEFDQEKENWFKSEMKRLAEEQEDILREIDDHPEWPFERVKQNLDRSTQIINEVCRLDSEHKQFLLDNLIKGLLEYFKIL